eukprot:TRINITY_DN30089_c1_g1_i1.p1 TRINITY_DN30089_c1_g1~~TRINITY_DN30089_c1_g1_i1.p1  ORF type:complete len:100 (+),score=2.10 TRINITY_DN30089_c1_g1_i1:57-356(+)
MRQYLPQSVDMLLAGPSPGAQPATHCVKHFVMFAQRSTAIRSAHIYSIGYVSNKHHLTISFRCRIQPKSPEPHRQKENTKNTGGICSAGLSRMASVSST